MTPAAPHASFAKGQRIADATPKGRGEGAILAVTDEPDRAVGPRLDYTVQWDDGTVETQVVAAELKPAG